MQVWVWVQAQQSRSVVNSTVKLGALDTENVSKQQSNDTQGAVMHHGIFNKKTH